ncbi:MAG: hypothetical protein SCH71_11710 [Desulfobulbaceae bacterium]|nr:hypothetical protein [Desulfobulbaceae bacterium]
MPDSKSRKERLIVLLIFGFLALNYPLLSLFSKVKLVFGIPVLYLYIFTVWSIFIGCIALILEKNSSPSLPGHLPKSQKSE